MNSIVNFFIIICVNNTLFFVLNDAMLHLSRGPVAVYLAGAQLAPANGIISFVFPTNKLLPWHIALFIVFLYTNSHVYNLYLLTLD